MHFSLETFNEIEKIAQLRAMHLRPHLARALRFERLRGQPAERDRGLQFMHPIAENSKAVRPLPCYRIAVESCGHPISHSTNLGFRRREVGSNFEDPDPSLELMRSRRREIRKAC